MVTHEPRVEEYAQRTLVLRDSKLTEAVPEQSTMREPLSPDQLLVVIAIIAILAAILFQSSRAQEQARRAVPVEPPSAWHGSSYVLPGLRQILPCDYYACNSSTTHSRLVAQIKPYIRPTGHVLPVGPLGRDLDAGFAPTDANMAAGNISYYCFSYDRVPNTVSPGKSNYSTWISWGFLPSNAGNTPRVMDESWDPSCWLFSDGWCKLTRDNYGVTIHESHNGSINICYLDGHGKFQGGEAKAVFK